MRRRVGSLAAIELVLVGVGAVAARAVDRLGPPSWSGGQLGRWYEEAPTDALVATAGLALVIGLAAWLAGAAALQLLAELVPARPLRTIADRVAPAALRTVGRTFADVALGASVLLAPLSTGLDPGRPAPPAVEGAPGTATLRPVGPAGPVDPTPEAAAPGLGAVHPAEVLPEAASVVVATGDSFWSIAEDVLSSRLGHPASDDEIDGFWRQLMARNGDRLVVPGNFDLLYAGQVLALPEDGTVRTQPQLAETL